jgi:hypothetical protein
MSWLCHDVVCKWILSVREGALSITLPGSNFDRIFPHHSWNMSPFMPSG